MTDDLLRAIDAGFFHRNVRRTGLLPNLRDATHREPLVDQETYRADIEITEIVGAVRDRRGRGHRALALQYLQIDALLPEEAFLHAEIERREAADIGPAQPQGNRLECRRALC